MRKALCLGLGLALLGAVPLRAQSGPADPELEAGIRQVDEGDFEAATKSLTHAVQRLQGKGGQARELSRAYLYLGIANLQLSQEQAARAKFVEALKNDQTLKLSPYEFPPKVIQAFEKARQDAAPPKPAKPQGPKVPPSVMMEAVRTGDFAASRQMLSDDPSVANAKDEKFGATPLHWAALRGHQAIAALLIAQGANLTATNNDGETPLQVAERSDHLEVASLLKQAGGGAPPAGGGIFVAVKAGDVASVRQLIQENPALVNLRDTGFGATPLHWAALKGHASVVELLIEKGADTTATNSSGETALQVAERGKKDKVADLLRNAGARPNAATGPPVATSGAAAAAGSASIFEAVRAGDANTVFRLISENPGLVREKDKRFGATPLHWAALKGHKEIVQFLLARGADRSATNADGETALQVAQRGGKSEVVALLK